MSANSGEMRREKILEALSGASGPLSGAALAEQCGVSRQVIVTDVALLRSSGNQIVSTNRGYVLLTDKSARPTRLFKCCHTAKQAADELTCIVDLGARVEDVLSITVCTEKYRRAWIWEAGVMLRALWMR